jgi:hypothetical protein
MGLEMTLVTKSEDAIAVYFSWQKLLRKATVHAGLSRMMIAMTQSLQLGKVALLLHIK